MIPSKRSLFLVLTFAMSTLATPGSGQQTAPSRSDATAIIQSIGYTNVTIGSIVWGLNIETQGVGRNRAYTPEGLLLRACGTGCATVLGIATREGQTRRFARVLFWDQDLGWHWFEITDSRIRLWTVTGYRELTN